MCLSLYFDKNHFILKHSDTHVAARNTLVQTMGQYQATIIAALSWMLSHICYTLLKPPYYHFPLRWRCGPNRQYLIFICWIWHKMSLMQCTSDRQFQFSNQTDLHTLSSSWSWHCTAHGTVLHITQYCTWHCSVVTVDVESIHQSIISSSLPPAAGHHPHHTHGAVVHTV